MPINYLVGAAAILVIGLSWAGNERNEVQLQHDHYCEMVQIHKDSNGQHGWPPYKGDCQ